MACPTENHRVRRRLLGAPHKAGHDAGECDKPRLNLRLIRNQCHGGPIGKDEGGTEIDPGPGIVPAHDRGHVAAADEQPSVARQRSRKLTPLHQAELSKNRLEEIRPARGKDRRRRGLRRPVRHVCVAIGGAGYQRPCGV